MTRGYPSTHPPTPTTASAHRPLPKAVTSPASFPLFPVAISSQNTYPPTTHQSFMRTNLELHPSQERRSDPSTHHISPAPFVYPFPPVSAAHTKSAVDHDNPSAQQP
jgi:hypothetical protein